MRQGPSYLVFWVTQNCNARCAFCFNHEENLRKNNDLTIEEITRIAISWSGLRYMTLAGGEPTLRQDLPEIIEAFVTHSGLSMCSIVTNGLKWRSILEQAERAASRHPKLGLNIGVSIDFIGAEHDANRKVEGCYEGCIKVIEGVLELRRRLPNLMVNAVGTYTKASAPSIEATAHTIMSRYGIPYCLNLVRGSIEDPVLKDIDIGHYEATARRILRMEETVIPKTTWMAPFRFALEEEAVGMIARTAAGGGIQSTCVAGRQGVLLESNGTLRLCELRPDAFGNVRDHGYDVPGMLRTPESAKVVTDMLMENCHCTWECLNRANAAFDATRWPRLAARVIRKHLWSRP
ncbi:MAG: radical SAM protein [Planctomycetota bacterium]